MVSVRAISIEIILSTSQFKLHPNQSLQVIHPPGHHVPKHLPVLGLTP